MNWLRPNHVRRAGVGLAAVALGGFLLGSALQTDDSVSATADAGTVDVQSTGWHWHDKPIYRLTNHSSHVLTRVTVFSWSEELQPMLYIGFEPPQTFSERQPVMRPPYILSPGQSVWFAGSVRPPAKFAVEWQVKGHAHYENVSTQ